MNYKTLLFASLFFTISMVSCKHSHSAKDKMGKEYTSAYVCPMHCEGSGSHEMGTCPVCKMDYVKNEDVNDGHDHDGHDHDGHDHDH